MKNDDWLWQPLTSRKKKKISINGGGWVYLFYLAWFFFVLFEDRLLSIS